MEYDLILSAVGKHVTLTDEEKKYFTSLLHPHHFARKKILIREGEVSTSSIFVLSGCLRGFTIDKSGMEHVLNFAPSGWWISDIYSLITQKPGQLNIEAIEDSDVFLMSRKDQEILFLKVPKFERFFRILIENALVANQQRLLDNLSLTAEERYLKFCKTYPTLIHHLPQKQLASYVGVTPEFFSRMRTNLLRK
jgi:CRP-like cAMP-binding protein